MLCLRGMKAKGVTPILNVSDVAVSFAWFAKWGWRKLWDWGTPLGSCSLRVGYTDDEALAECAGGTGDSIQCYGGVARVEEAIELGAAGMKLLGHGALGLLLFAHGLLQLPRQHALDSDGLELFTDAFGFEEAIEG